jgi:hypothetical protein
MTHRFDPEVRLCEADPKTLGQRLPKPLHERIEELCELLYAAGKARPTKVKMLSALILGAPIDVDTLDQMLRTYDAAKVYDCPITKPSKGSEVVYPDRTSGPRGSR